MKRFIIKAIVIASMVCGCGVFTCNATEQERFYVTDEDQFFQALGNDRIIVIDSYTTINLSKVLQSSELNFSSYSKTRWVDEGNIPDETGPLVISEAVYDGRQLVLKGFNNLTIQGDNHSSIMVVPRYADVISFIDCTNCTISNLTIGHTNEGHCTGGVLSFVKGSKNRVINCAIFGCGNIGIEASRTQQLSVINTEIYDCTYGILYLNTCLDVEFENCDFRENKGSSVVINGCVGVNFSKCFFYNNDKESKMFNLDREINMKSCVIYHPIGLLGDKEKIVKQNELVTLTDDGNTYYSAIEQISIFREWVGPDKEE